MEESLSIPLRMKLSEILMANKDELPLFLSIPLRMKLYLSYYQWHYLVLSIPLRMKLE